MEERTQYTLFYQLPDYLDITDVDEVLRYLYEEPLIGIPKPTTYNKEKAELKAHVLNVLNKNNNWENTGLVPGTMVVVRHRHVLLGEWTEGNC